MPANDANPPEGPFEGSRCVAGPGGHWGPATIRRVNEDGTFKVEFDAKDMVLMPYWHGVTPDEVSFDDAGRWAPVFARLSPDGQALARADFPAALAALGYRLTPDQAGEYWDRGCRELFAAGRDALDEAAAYRLFLRLGVSARQCAESLEPGRPRPYLKLYWNQTRMGGRDPSEVSRPVTLADALAALGLTAAAVDPLAAAFLRRVEQRHGVRLPATLVDLLGRAGVGPAVHDCHPNNPTLVEFADLEWDLRRGLRERGLDGEYGLTVMFPHQGDHEWAVVFDDGEADGRVYLWRADGGEEDWQPTAPGVGHFFWDLAQTGLAWYQDTRLYGGKPARRTDIGLALGP